MAEKFDYFKFQNAVNPFGILFHPMAIEKVIGFVANGKKFIASDIFFHNERWHCFEAHSDLSDPDPNLLLQNLNNKVSETHQQLSSASHAIITLGTAWVYRNIDSDAIVANCHKIPQRQFKKELLSVQAIQKSIQNTVAFLKQMNPALQIIFTISPVRHIKDGFIENQWSKSNLISALQEIAHQSQSFGTKNLHYFPSYEIMMDELRDYRFYAEDMIHPNQTAIGYIWKRFSETWISEASTSMMIQIDSIQKSLQHRPFNPNSESHQSFLSKLNQQISELQAQFPHIRF
ncbi:hypothetical protein FNO01nite_00730 [Flavobacterium noncentrifugens]|nr:hypothetical protein FNO01nite_00730 [Flavobacterium noncentrifugens]